MEERRARFWTRMHGGTIELPIRLLALFSMFLIGGGAMLGEFTASLGTGDVAWGQLAWSAVLVALGFALLGNRVRRPGRG
ncbi:MAG TPA: hypothetical protein VF158_05665 [Longimicrobiales bacterium]